MQQQYVKLRMYAGKLPDRWPERKADCTNLRQEHRRVAPKRRTETTEDLNVASLAKIGEVENQQEMPK